MFFRSSLLYFAFIFVEDYHCIYAAFLLLILTLKYTVLNIYNVLGLNYNSLILLRCDKLFLIDSYISILLRSVPVKNCINHLYKHCVKSVRIRSYSGPYFPAFGLNTDQNNPE